MNDPMKATACTAETTVRGCTEHAHATALIAAVTATHDNAKVSHTP
jgi:hypothetical protein